MIESGEFQRSPASGGTFGGSRSGHADLKVKYVGVNAWRSGGRRYVPAILFCRARDNNHVTIAKAQLGCGKAKARAGGTAR